MERGNLYRDAKERVQVADLQGCKYQCAVQGRIVS